MKGALPFIAIAALAVALIIVAVGGQYLVGIASLTGMTPMSLSQASFTSKSDFFNGEKMWILSATQGGIAARAQGTIDNADIGSKSGTKPVNDLTLDITYSEQSCEYPIEVNYNALAITRLQQPTEWGCLFYPSDAEALRYCPSGAVYKGKYSGALTCFCVAYADHTGAIGKINNPYVHTISDITVSTAGKSETKRFDTKGNLAGYLGTNVYAQWNGYLSTGVCDSQATYLPFYTNGQWYVGSSDQYGYYTQVWNDLSSSVGGGITRDNLVNKINNVNRYADGAMTNQYFGYVNNPASLSAALIKKDMSSFIAVPVWTFYVKAAWLGIYVPTAQVQIEDIRSSTFKSGAEGTIYVSVHNIGDERGTVDVSASCPSPFTQVGGTQSSTLEPGVTSPFYIRIQGSSDRSTCGTCTVTASTLGKGVSKTVQVCVDPHAVCEPGKSRCVINDIKQCNEFGSAEVLVKSCSADEVCQYDQFASPVCMKKGTTAVPTFNIGDVLTWIVVGLVISAVLLVLLMFAFPLAGLKMLMSRWYLVIILWAVLGVGIGIGLYMVTGWFQSLSLQKLIGL